MQGAQVQSSVRELRSHTPQGVANKTNKKFIKKKTKQNSLIVVLYIIKLLLLLSSNSMMYVTKILIPIFRGKKLLTFAISLCPVSLVGSPSLLGNPTNTIYLLTENRKNHLWLILFPNLILTSDLF